ncbi:MAG: cation-translocating P-type ATPase [Candidatus Delongbacteria bacterium]
MDAELRAGGRPPPAARAGQRPWHVLSLAELCARLESAPEGLGSAEAARRLARDGPNRLTAARRFRPLRSLLGQFKSLLVWILIAAGLLSLLLGQGLDALAILLIVALNAASGFRQEYSAEKSIAALGKLTAPLARVQRDGAVCPLPAADVVAGDLLLLEAGDVVAADARLLASASLRCVESTLTGESEAAEKRPEPLAELELPLGERANLVFMGTHVAAGTGRALVVGTGMDTELGCIAGLIQAADAEPVSSLQRKLEVFGRVLVKVALGIVALLFGLGLLRHVPLLELVMTSVGLAVAAVPEGLPAVVTVALSLGVLRMSRRRALVRRLAAVETLGSTSVICTDKTGTLTLGEMTVRALHTVGQDYVVTGAGYGPAGAVQPVGPESAAAWRAALDELAAGLVGGNQAQVTETGGVWSCVGDPTEGALLVAGGKAGADRARLEARWPAVLDFPFDSGRKRSTTLRRLEAGGLRAFCNGAPDPLLALCTHCRADGVDRPLAPADREQIQSRVSELARQGLRVLGCARRDLESAAPADLTVEEVERDLVFLGLAGLHDPPRAEARDALAACQAAGIRVVMITGDHPDTARAIARELGLPAAAGQVLSGLELDRLSEEQLQKAVADAAVYARVSAGHKLRIVRALQADGAVVAMTGDGVNDAPALKGADIGIAMGRSGTEVTRQAADLIITDDNFATIVHAVAEGRGIYANIRKTLQYLLAGNTGELLLMTACIVPGLPVPLLPIHLLWINLVTDGLPALCLATDPADPDLMRKAPRPPGERLADRDFLRSMLLTGLLTAGVAFAVYLQTLRTAGPAAARSSAFAVLVFAELWRAFGARSATRPVWRLPLAGNLNLVGVVALSIGLQFWSQHSVRLGAFLQTTPLSYPQGLLLLALGTLPLAVLELLKVLRPGRPRARGNPPVDSGGEPGERGPETRKSTP